MHWTSFTQSWLTQTIVSVIRHAQVLQIVRPNIITMCLTSSALSETALRMWARIRWNFCWHLIHSYKPFRWLMCHAYVKPLMINNRFLVASKQKQEAMLLFVCNYLFVKVLSHFMRKAKPIFEIHRLKNWKTTRIWVCFI